MCDSLSFKKKIRSIHMDAFCRNYGNLDWSLHMLEQKKIVFHSISLLIRIFVS